MMQLCVRAIQSRISMAEAAFYKKNGSSVDWAWI